MRTKFSILLSLFLSSAALYPLSAKNIEQISGKAYVIDGDTIVINNTHIRLYGIDAPETKQKCDWGYSGHNATRYLESLIKNKIVYCTIFAKDAYDRPIGACHTQSHDINAKMVASGHAFAYRRYSQKYIGLEETAKKSNIGIWRANCENPELLRRRNIF